MKCIIAITPAHILAPEIAIAACKAGELGVLDFGFEQNADALKCALTKLTRGAGIDNEWGIRYDVSGDSSRHLNRLADLLRDSVPNGGAPALLLAGVEKNEIATLLKIADRLASKVFLEVYDLPSARAAEDAGYDGVVIKGCEAGGKVSKHSSFILLQELHGKLSIPYWIEGGVGLHSAAAAVLSGAAGVVLRDQLWLTEEASFVSTEQRKTWSQLDGSETTLIGRGDSQFRLFSRSGRAKLHELELAAVQDQPRRETSEATALHDTASSQTFFETLLRFLLDSDDPLIPMGQDIAFAGALAKRFGTVGRIIAAFGAHIDESLKQAGEQLALAPDSPLARMHGTRFPIVQGPMTRVSDMASFASAVAAGGALPFLALAVMRGPQIRALLTEAKTLLANAPWGVGILGFMPLELRQEQLEVIRDARPPFAIIAGGRPSQARELEALGVSTYLHVPSPGLLQGFLKDGARRFVFEGLECGGHTGPRTSFILWQSAVDTLMSAEINDPGNVQVLFAGGIHDALSAAMVSVIAAPLVARGMKIGVLMGTAYLFTEEIVKSGAIIEEFQRQAVKCEETALLQSGVGIYTRCAQTSFCEEFNLTRRELMLASKSEEEILTSLELLNVGRLRIASKGIAHNDGKTHSRHTPHLVGKEPDKSKLETSKYVNVDLETQRREGMYMLGEVARLRDTTFTIAALHASVCVDSQSMLRRIDLRPATESERKRRAAIADRAHSHEDIAIVGMACLLPGAENMRAYWRNILQRVDAIREVSDERWRPVDLFDPKRGTPDKIYSKWGGFLDDIPFDPTIYGIAPASLGSIEPMQLLALEVVRQALEDAGFDRRPFPRERTATIIASGGMNDLGTIYIFRTLLAHYLPKVPNLSEETRRHIMNTLYEDEIPKWTEDSFPGILGNVAAGRVANRFDLRGANFVVDAACASSLAALDVGIKQLRNRDADVALVGAIDGTNNAMAFMSFAQTHALSPRGRCRPFDNSADGIAISEGVGALVLKRLEDAERDGDRIHALIKGIGSSSDGRNRSLTAPHPQGQVSALKRAYEDAGVDPATVELIEAHGTGTALGDKSEIESLNMAFGDSSMSKQSCAIGSVKSMIGHAKVAAGLASLIKSALALKHRTLPPTLGVEKPNGHVDFPKTPFYVNTETRPWFANRLGHPRRCGVSAFGFGGTNFHAVLEEYTGAYRDSDRLDLTPRDAEIFAFQGADRADVAQAARRLLEGLEHPEHIDLATLAYSLHREQRRAQAINSKRSSRPGESASKERLPCRLTLVAASVSDLKQKLTWTLDQLNGHAGSKFPPGIYYQESATETGKICFLFPGQGSQKINMLRDLVATSPALQGIFERADATLAEDLTQPLSRFIYPIPVFTDEERGAQQRALNATDIAQPALGAVDLAAFEVLTRYGVHPDFMAGHSYGEYAALCAAGALTPVDLIRLSRIRGRIAAQASPGAMAAVEADGTQTAEIIAQQELKVSIANLNAPDQTIIAGTIDAIDQAVALFTQASLRIKKIPVSAAFHSPLMDDARESLATELAKIPFHPLQTPVYSNTLAGPYPQDADEARKLLARHIAEPVKFVEEINALYDAGVRLFIECGPGLVLSGLTDRILSGKPHTTLAVDAPGRSGWLQLAHLLSQALTLGVPVHLDAWFASRGLKESSLDEIFADARARANPSPLTWRVNGGRATPWRKGMKDEGGRMKGSNPRRAVIAATPKPTLPPPTEGRSLHTSLEPVPASDGWAARKASAANSTSQYAEAANAASRPSGAYRDSFLIANGRNAMINDSPSTKDAGPPLSASPRCSESQFIQIQHSINQFIELQHEQQRTWRRFLDFQANLVGMELHRPHAASGASMTYAPPAIVPVNGPAVLEAVPPAPVLPTQFIAPHVDRPNGEPVKNPSPPPPQTEPPRRDGEDNGAATGRPEPKLASVDNFKADLLRAVSERTGYPEDMLQLDAHMEADLGIDSIKRIEIFSKLKDHYNLLEGRDEEAVLEELSGLKTLNEIIAWRAKSSSPANTEGRADSPKKSLTPPSLLSNETVESSIEPRKEDRIEERMKEEGGRMKKTNSADGAGSPSSFHDPVQCYSVQPIAAHMDTPAEPKDLPIAYPILLVGSPSPLNSAFHAALKIRGYSVRQLIPGAMTQALEDDRFEVDFTTQESVNRLHALFKHSDQPVGAIINLMGVSTGRDASNKHHKDARSLFLLLKTFEQDLKNSAQDGAGRLINLTSFDGQFGLSRSRVFPVGAAGTLGVAKSIAREWPSVQVKCIDVAPTLEPGWLVDKILLEIRAQDPGVEVGYTAQGRWRLDLKLNGAGDDDLSELKLETGAVVLITGGAYGITADVTRALAEKYHPRLILIGRSAMPQEEPAATRKIDNPGELRQHLIKDLRAQRGKVTPAEVDRVHKRILKDRQILANLNAMRAAGATIEYHGLDVRDADAFGTLIDDVYARYGRIDGVLHGAGVINDKLIGDKSLESFDTVFDTKVTPAIVLANKLRPSMLKFLIFFSSVAGRFGNVGQCDYSAANEVLNKLANRLSHAWPHVHTLSINWGPWDAGMVTDELRKLYATRSIRPIPAEVGRRYCLEELARGATGAPEIVISSSIEQIATLRAGRQTA